MSVFANSAKAILESNLGTFRQIIIWTFIVCDLPHHSILTRHWLKNIIIQSFLLPTGDKSSSVVAAIWVQQRHSVTLAVKSAVYQVWAESKCVWHADSAQKWAIK